MKIRLKNNITAQIQLLLVGVWVLSASFAFSNVANFADVSSVDHIQTNTVDYAASSDHSTDLYSNGCCSSDSFEYTLEEKEDEESLCKYKKLKKSSFGSSKRTNFSSSLIEAQVKSRTIAFLVAVQSRQFKQYCILNQVFRL